MSRLTTWRKEIEAARESADDSSLIACTLTAQEMDRPFYPGFGGEEGVPFTAWSKHRVYFPTCYDGSEWVSSVPREPCDEETRHVGGG